MVRWARSGAAETLPRAEQRVAVASAAVLYLLGASLIGTAFLLPSVESPFGAAAVAVTAYLTAAALIAAVILDRGGLRLALLADIWGVVLIVFLCASTGGASSPFALLYFFVDRPRGRVSVAHTLPRRVRRRTARVPGAADLSEVATGFFAIACVGAVLALLTTAAIHIALERMRTQRRRLEFLIAATAKLDMSLDPQQTLRRIAGTATPELAELCVIDLLEKEGDRGRRGVGGGITLRPPRSNGCISRTRPTPRRKPGRRRADDAHRPSVRPLGSDHGTGWSGTGDEHPRFMAAAGYPRGRRVPDGRPRTDARHDRVHAARSRSDGQLEVLEDLTGRASLAFDNARLYAERTRVAQTLRHSLMPAALPQIPGLQLESFFRPMGAGSEVGGDFYDVFGDAATAGWWSATCAARAPRRRPSRASCATRPSHTRASDGARRGPRPGSTRRCSNRTSKAASRPRSSPDCARRSGVQVTVAAAGHPAALVSRAHGRAEAVGACGTLLGVFADPSIPETTTCSDPATRWRCTRTGSPRRMPRARVDRRAMVERLAGDAPGSARAAIESLLALVDLGDGARDDIAILAAHVDPVSSGA